MAIQASSAARVDLWDRCDFDLNPNTPAYAPSESMRRARRGRLGAPAGRVSVCVRVAYALIEWLSEDPKPRSRQYAAWPPAFAGSLACWLGCRFGPTDAATARGDPRPIPTCGPFFCAPRTPNRLSRAQSDRQSIDHPAAHMLNSSRIPLPTQPGSWRRSRRRGPNRRPLWMGRRGPCPPAAPAAAARTTAKAAAVT